MRLIDADHFKKMIAGGAIKTGTETAAGLGAAICRLVDAEPTAYDVDKVVEQLEEYRYRVDYGLETDNALEGAIGIVQKGGTE